MFFFCMVGQAVSGHLQYNEEAEKDGYAKVGFAEYLTTGHFGEALFENWESEFLQMGMFVLMTAYLYQKGSAESNDPQEEGGGEGYPLTTSSPWPARQGGWVRKVYAYSLPTALLMLFLLSFYAHAATGLHDYARDHAGATLLDYMSSSRFWFESMQNWQSEFLSVAILSVLSIFLRQSNSPESKPVNKPNWETGAD
jgi:hypothetical protein